MFVVAVATGRVVSILLFSLISFLALREFVTLAPTRPGDHRALFWSFFIVTPLQYYLVWIEWYGLFSILIPVYVSIFLAIRTALAGDTEHFLERTAINQWGLMICVYFISHVPALLMLRIPGYENQNAKLMFFLVLIVQLSDVLQFVWGKTDRPAPGRAIDQSEQNVGRIDRRRRLRDAGGRGAVVGDAVRARSGRRHGARAHDDGLRRRLDHVGDQARSRRQGLRRNDQRPRRHPRPDRLPVLRRAGVLSPHPILFHALDHPKVTTRSVLYGASRERRERLT